MTLALDSGPTPRMAERPYAISFAAAAVCVALTDWLFYGVPGKLGLSFPLLLAVLGVIAIAINGSTTAPRRAFALSGLWVALLVAQIEDVGPLSVTMGLLGTALYVIAMTRRHPSSWIRDVGEVLTIPFRGPIQLILNTVSALREARAPKSGWQAWLLSWTVPVLLFAIFLTLFTVANPLIENFVEAIRLDHLAQYVDGWRLWFWVLILCPIWPLIRVRQRTPKGRLIDIPGIPADNFLFGKEAVLRSLVLFNLLFAVDSGLDLTYLWGGVSLPDGTSYAVYAHQGAYPLIATALLAAGFALIAMRPSGPATTSRLIRPLVAVWIAQNVLLVISSILRLDLYVKAYGLTGWRVAAFIWMGLVAIGLVLILVQLVGRKSNFWLLSANAISLGVVLYAYCFVNTPQLVAAYNIEHCREAGGTGPELDLNYLRVLGPAIAPVLYSHRQNPALTASKASDLWRSVSVRPAASSDWRNWSFRAWRLQRYLANNPEATQDGKKG